MSRPEYSQAEIEREVTGDNEYSGWMLARQFK